MSTGIIMNLSANYALTLYGGVQYGLPGSFNVFVIPQNNLIVGSETRAQQAQENRYYPVPSESRNFTA